jgi:hypothetical protein
MGTYKGNNGVWGGEGEKGDFAWFGTLIKDYTHDHKIKFKKKLNY